MTLQGLPEKVDLEGLLREVRGNQEQIVLQKPRQQRFFWKWEVFIIVRGYRKVMLNKG